MSENGLHVMVEYTGSFRTFRRARLRKRCVHEDEEVYIYSIGHWK